MNYLALLIPITVGYMVHYYLMKHEYKELEYKYKNLVQIQKKQRLSKKREQYEEE